MDLRERTPNNVDGFRLAVELTQQTLPVLIEQVKELHVAVAKIARGFAEFEVRHTQLTNRVTDLEEVLHKHSEVLTEVRAVHKRLKVWEKVIVGGVTTVGGLVLVLFWNILIGRVQLVYLP